MPLAGTGHAADSGEHLPYFKNLAELDVWAEKPARKLGTIPFTPRSEGEDRHGRLLVCHDYKGGYTESPSAPSYTFNFWSRCDVFIYFSHHCVTVPPSGWINAAHRQGVKMLGTLIFEGAGEEDCLRLLVGRLPKGTTGAAAPSTVPDTLPLSPYYARVLADLAHQRGFDGYLLNFECPLRGGIEQTRALSAWIALLQGYMRTKVGPHAETIWYDSVVLNGQLRWQDRLNSLNLPFFLPSTGFFTNYTWPASYPAQTAAYLLSVDQPKPLRDVYVGVDVWGRGQHGGGGLGSFRALAHIAPHQLGLSAALFGPAWTWESEQDKPGWDWAAWWKYERLLWLGPEIEGEAVEVPEAPRREGEPECIHEAFAPVAKFFAGRPAVDPAQRPFCARFCPGVGWAWFVDGARVLEKAGGWTDVDKQTGLGDLLWPRPGPVWEGGEREEAIPSAKAALEFGDAWQGGSSLRLVLAGAGSEAEDAFFRCVWVPVQALATTPGKRYRATLVYKTEDDEAGEVDVGLSTRTADGNELETTPEASEEAYDLPGGWSRIAIDFVAAGNVADVGVVVGYAMEDPTKPYELGVRLGQLAVFPAPTPAVLQAQSKVLWASYSPATRELEWECATTLPAVRQITLQGPDDPQPAWRIDEDSVVPAMAYFNLYAQAHPIIGAPRGAFLGTTGLDGRANRWFVDRACFTATELSGDGGKLMRVYVQGVTEPGKVLSWDRCAYVDVRLADLK